MENDSRTIDAEPIRLLTRVTCPHCWETFPPEQVLWISEHVELLGDPMLGPERQQRFLPSRFTVEGDAVDAKGMTCRDLACPHCHLAVPRAMLEMEPLFYSILGSPASGKSYFLTTMTWQLRQVLPMHFHVAFTDADPTANRVLNASEESLFLNPEETKLIPLGNLIRKTELQGELYDTVAYGQQTVSYPRPLLFTMQPREGHSRSDSAKLARMLCLYDNAGEHFQPGQDTASSPVTRHLGRSRAVLFLFDPTQDLRFRSACRGVASGHLARRHRPDGSAGRRRSSTRPRRGSAAMPDCRTPHRSTGRWSSSSRSSTSGTTCSTPKPRATPGGPSITSRASTWTGSSTSRNYFGESSSTTAPKPWPPSRASRAISPTSR